MLDDDNLPVLSAVVRDGDAAVIRAARLGFESVPADDSSARPKPRRQRTGGAPGDRLASIGTGAACARHGVPSGPPAVFGATPIATDEVARIDLGHAPVGIDANRDIGGKRASRLLADVRVAEDRSARTAGVPAAVDADELDDTLALDDDIVHATPAPPRRRAARMARRSDRRDDPAPDFIERLVDEIVERHVRTLRREVRALVEHTLDRDPDRDPGHMRD